MCSRESCAVLPSQLVAMILVFLATFLVGVLAFQVIFWLAGAVEIAESDFTQIEEPKNFVGCENPDSLEFMIWFTGGPAIGADSRQLGITNNGTDSIHYFPYEVRFAFDRTREANHTATNLNSDRYKEITLEPGVTGTFPLPADGPVDLVFQYRYGKAQSFRSIHAHFTGYVPDCVR